MARLGSIKVVMATAKVNGEITPANNKADEENEVLDQIAVDCSSAEFSGGSDSGPGRSGGGVENQMGCGGSNRWEKRKHNETEPGERPKKKQDSAQVLAAELQKAYAKAKSDEENSIDSQRLSAEIAKAYSRGKRDAEEGRFIDPQILKEEIERAYSRCKIVKFYSAENKDNTNNRLPNAVDGQTGYDIRSEKEPQPSSAREEKEPESAIDSCRVGGQKTLTTGDGQSVDHTSMSAGSPSSTRDADEVCLYLTFAQIRNLLLNCFRGTSFFTRYLHSFFLLSALCLSVV